MSEGPSRRRAPRLAAGRARALGLPTRGTTNPNRLRRMDNWIAAVLGPDLRAAPDPLVIDLGYGATPVTAVELASRLARVRPDVRVLGLDPV
ncbi:MAG: class I SAM-dependent methyltransferase, partial [Jatrophihabitans endophyticus]|nr:class I SAM-dependent methyltransferase [Jatrophihabitans endophyticus]